MDQAEPRFFSPAEGDFVDCALCPHRCRIGPGKAGRCRVRANRGGKPWLPARGRLSSVAVDPIEKKPLFHFMPGSRIFSVGFFGCNMSCPFCQNWEISQVEAQGAAPTEAESLVKAALSSGAPSIAFTYSEPLVHVEYLLEASLLARRAGLRVVLVTNGCMEEGPARELLPLLDAANVDLKCWDPEAYRRILGGGRDAVLRFIGLAKEMIHVEVCTLVVPGLDDWPSALEGIASFVAGLSPDIPLHLSAYHPAWKHDAPPTPPSLLEKLTVAAERHLRYVYPGNLAGRPTETRCPSCAQLLVRRRGYAVDLPGLAEGGGPASPADGKLRRARCASCSAELPILVQAERQPPGSGKRKTAT